MTDSGDRLQGSKENASGLAFGLAGDVQAEVIAVDEIDVSVARRSEEHAIAVGGTGGGVSRGVIGSKVGFGFNDATGKNDATGSKMAMFAADQKFSKKVAGHGAGIAEVEGAWHRLEL